MCVGWGVGGGVCVCGGTEGGREGGLWLSGSRGPQSIVDRPGRFPPPMWKQKAFRFKGPAIDSKSFGALPTPDVDCFHIRAPWSLSCSRYSLPGCGRRMVWSVGSHSVLGTDPGQLCHNTPSVSSARALCLSASSSSSVIDTKFNLNGNIEIFLILYQG